MMIAEMEVYANKLLCLSKFLLEHVSRGTEFPSCLHGEENHREF